MLPDVSNTPKPIPSLDLDLEETKHLVEKSVDAVQDGADAVGKVVSDGIEAVAGTAREALGVVWDFMRRPLEPQPRVALPKPEDIFKNPFAIMNPFEVVVDIMPRSFVSLPGFLSPESELSPPRLEGLDPMTALFMIMSYMEERLGSTMEQLGALTEVQAQLQDAATEDLQNGVDKDDPKSATAKAKVEIGKELGAEFATLELADVTSAINALTFQVQRTESFRQQLNTMVSNLLKSDHEAKMVTLRNIPTR